MISIIVLTLNEARDLAHCLDSIEWSDDIHVVDSGSSDNTIEIAKSYNASTYYNPFTGFGDQRNWAIENCKTKYRWLLFLDADERSTEAFRQSVNKAVLNASPETIGFYLCSKTMLKGSWLKRSDNFPKWQFRLLSKGKALFVNAGHGQKESGNVKQIKYIKEPYIHNAFSKGWEQWEEKHKKYAKDDAKDASEKVKILPILFNKSGSQRKIALKKVLRQMKLWPYIRFVYTYFFCLGLLDGLAGLQYSKKILWYEKLIQQEIRSIQASQNHVV